MRKSKIITIEGRGEVTVKEISPLLVYEAWNADNRIEEIKRLLDGTLEPAFDVIKTWYASEHEQIIEAFLEVNAAFFGIASALKIDGALSQIAQQIVGSLPAVFASSFRQGMQEPGITDGNSI